MEIGQRKQCGPKVPCFLLAQAVGPKTGWPVVSDRGQLRGVIVLSLHHLVFMKLLFSPEFKKLGLVEIMGFSFGQKIM